MRNKKRLHRKRRIRAKISGTKKCPRLSVFRSLRGLSVQIIDDENGKTILSANTKEATVDGAKKVGKNISEKCVKAKIQKIVFDRSGYKYHGKIKALADEVRKGGIKF
ncbi:MAG TPA: 50S ribosomal protein L18 [Candidatus Moranbacteria bacterium]|nr:50S ribosomal protein L18 [Candidatus Moranbacteria bacterium]